MIRTFKRLKFAFKIKKFLPFMKDYIMSDEVPVRSKAIGFLLVIAYTAFPLDFIPDFFSIFGIMDDLFIAGIVINQMIKTAPLALKKKHGLENAAF
ncbi:YkvA family protein [Peribacillus sp. SCS-37]|uniref:YkvA family protein n=1 Tax=Paraperibacillus esterisolvens TaxID=3115296 RepID=UPI003905B394